MIPLSQLADQWSAISDLLDRALALPAHERMDFVSALQGNEAQFRDTLLQLLAQPALHETNDFLRTLPRLSGDAAPGSLADLSHGDLIGSYRLIRELGAGGMGAVWLAERSDGSLKRKVALKLPRLAWGRGLAERLGRERDILAALEHPNISRLYDAGVDQHGRPYLALEYVEGKPIDVYAKDRGVSVRHKLELILQVCAAVAFAHSRLVVHRDLKPSNILVTADGQVRLLDFGIAKLMEDGSTKETQLTQLSGRALTLDYASPEQIKGEPIGTASDVYSLGVVAYELLTGAKPYRLRRGSAAELEEAIATADVQALKAAATDPAAARAMPADLNVVIQKSLKKRPAERYMTVAEFAQDIHAVLGHQPVSARPDSAAYRLMRFSQRYRSELLVAGAVATALTIAIGLGPAALVMITMGVGLVLATWQATQARRGRQAAEAAAAEARQARALAQEREVEARQAARDAQRAFDESQRQTLRAQQAQRRAEGVKQFIANLFLEADPIKGQVASARVQDLLLSARHRINGELLDQPDVAVELLTLVGGGLTNLSEFAMAKEALEEARALGLRHAVEPITMARLYRQQAELLGVGGQLEEALALIEQSAAHVDAASSTEAIVCLLELDILKSALLANKGSLVDALAVAERAVALAESHADVPVRARVRAVSELAQQLVLGHAYERAIEATETALAATRSQGSVAPVLVAEVMSTRVIALGALGRLVEAETLARENVELLKRQLGEDHWFIAGAWAGLAGVLMRAGDMPGALVAQENSMRLRQHQGGQPESYDDGVRRRNVGILRLHLGDPTGAQRDFEAAFALIEREVGPDDAGTLSTRALRARAAGEAGNLDAAQCELVEIERRQAALGHPLAQVHVHLASIERRRGNLDLACRWADLAAGFADGHFGDEPLIVPLLEWARVRLAKRDPQAGIAIEPIRRVLARRPRPGPDHAHCNALEAQWAAMNGEANMARSLFDAAESYWMEYVPYSIHLADVRRDRASWLVDGPATDSAAVGRRGS